MSRHRGSSHRGSALDRIEENGRRASERATRRNEQEIAKNKMREMAAKAKADRNSIIRCSSLPGHLPPSISRRQVTITGQGRSASSLFRLTSPRM